MIIRAQFLWFSRLFSPFSDQMKIRVLVIRLRLFQARQLYVHFLKITQLIRYIGFSTCFFIKNDKDEAMKHLSIYSFIY